MPISVTAVGRRLISQPVLKTGLFLVMFFGFLAPDVLQQPRDLGHACMPPRIAIGREDVFKSSHQALLRFHQRDAPVRPPAEQPDRGSVVSRAGADRLDQCRLVEGPDCAVPAAPLPAVPEGLPIAIASSSSSSSIGRPSTNST